MANLRVAIVAMWLLASCRKGQEPLLPDATCRPAQQCVEQGIRLQASDEAQAARLFLAACNGGDPGGCTNLGFQFAKGTGVPRDEARARTLFERACDAGAGMACSNLGVMLLQGKGGVRDLPLAEHTLSIGCERGDPSGCSKLGVMLYNARRPHQDYLPPLTRGCSLGDAAGCRYLGTMHSEGRDFPRDLSLSKQHFARACTLGDTEACGFAEAIR